MHACMHRQGEGQAEGEACLLPSRDPDVGLYFRILG